MAEKESSAVFERLLRGEATSREYVDAVRREVAERREDYRKRRLRLWASHSPNDVEEKHG